MRLNESTDEWQRLRTSPLRPARDRAPLAGAVGQRRAPGRCPTPAIPAGTTPSRARATCSRCCPTPRASRTWATSRTTRWATCWRTTGAATACRCCTRWATTPSACRPRTTRSRRASTRPSRPTKSIDEFRRQFRSWGISIDWTREFGTHEPAYYRWTQWIFLRLLRARPRLPQGGAGQVVPQGSDRARQRAGDRRPLRALRQRASIVREARAVVLQDHRLRRAAAGRLQAARVWPERVITMQRNWIGRSEGAEVDLPLRGPGDRRSGLHDPARHAVRCDVLRAGARAPATSSG